MIKFTVNIFLQMRRECDISGCEIIPKFLYATNASAKNAAGNAIDQEIVAKVKCCDLLKTLIWNHVLICLICLQNGSIEYISENFRLCFEEVLIVNLWNFKCYFPTCLQVLRQ